MKCKEQKAYQQLVEELKNEFPLFRKYTDDFFYSKKKEEPPRGREGVNLSSQNGKVPDETKDICNTLVTEMETSFNLLEQKNRISCLCKLFLNNYSPFTNGYYDYIDSSYVSSSLVEAAMERYVAGGASQGEHSDAGGHISEIDAGGHISEIDAGGHISEIDAGGHINEIDAGGHINETNVEGLMSEINAVSAVTPLSVVARRPHKRESVGDAGNALGWDNGWASDSAGGNVSGGLGSDVIGGVGSDVIGDVGSDAIGSVGGDAIGSIGGDAIGGVCNDAIGSVGTDASAPAGNIPRSSPRSKPRGSPRTTPSDRRSRIGKRSRKYYETGAKMIGKSPHRGRYSDRGANAKRAKVWEGAARRDKGGGPSGSEVGEVGEDSKVSKISEVSSRSGETKRCGRSNSSGSIRSYRSNHSNGSNRSNGDPKNCVEDEVDNKDHLGFCDISLVPFADEAFYINYGCVGTSRRARNAGSVFVIDYIGGGPEKKEVAKCKRRITFGREGKKEFLHNINAHSIVKGWIYKADSKHKCFHVRLFAVRNDSEGSSGGRATHVTENSQTGSCGSGEDGAGGGRSGLPRSKWRQRSGGSGPSGASGTSGTCGSIEPGRTGTQSRLGKPGNHHVYACLPFQFISKFQFVDSLDMRGLRLEEDLNKFVGMNIRARIFDDGKYIRSHFEDLLGRYHFHFFLTLQWKGHDDHIKNDKLGFLSTQLSESSLMGQKGGEKKPTSEVDRLLLTRLDVLLFSCKRFMSKENLKYKEKYLFLNLPQLPSLIEFNFRNNFVQTHIGNVTTRKQNLIWSDQKFMEALEIYKKNSNYYDFLKNYFTFDSGSSACSYVYLSEMDKFEATNERTASAKVGTIKYEEEKEPNGDNPKQRNPILERKKERNSPVENSSNLKMEGNKNAKRYEDYWFSLNDREKYIVEKIPFLNSSVYKSKWIYDFFNCIKLTINLNNHHLWGNFLLSLVLLELSCYTECFLFLFRIFQIKKMFLESYKLKNVICSVFIRRLKKYISKEHLWNVIVNYREYDLFSMREDNCDEYCRNIFERNLSLLCALEKG
ncbi:hypothetical protein, conserved [Plasmodium vivax]|uniref:Uncharacterized protein n=1 Tax=Plasmodium vivax (strain Salvador I) TaxID=126793 RepID=A5K9Z8_PLAVS|nr:hypothetical protein, conserved [Plasmodium vivax]EDL43886.1 hypothetical protein, conserved [Plasmodium vivax]|eukprot:XP_001613613.1 hypothetical protein [Plasmodium vivax Sal-1]